jgi:hypothetical protein
VDAFSNPDPGDTSQQQGIGIEVVCAAQFYLQPLIVFWREGPREIFGTNREVFANNETGLERMALGGQVVEQTAKTQEALLARMIADRRTQLAKPPKPAQHVRIATEL